MKANKLTKETVSSVGVHDRSFDVFSIGDTVAVSQRIKEGDKSRIQMFEGDVICIRKGGISSTFTVRRIGAHGVAVERIFPYYSPLVEGVRRVRSGDVRRAKLFYIRGRVGKAARIKEKLVTNNNTASKTVHE